jgi:hypothetical protein
MTSVLTPSERRSNRRYPLQIPVRYRAANGPLNSAWKGGRALDMSASGILVHVPESVELGMKLELAMDWTGLYHDRPTMRLHLVAAAIRIDGRGTALRILSHRFRDASSMRVRLRRAEESQAVA